MKIAIIGRSEILYSTAKLLLAKGYEIALVITAKSSPEYTKKENDFKSFAKKINARYIFSTDLNQNLEEIKNTKCEIAVSINFSKIISKKIIDIFPLGILNAHAGDLPRYRGNACIAWAILNGENKIGLCVHSMVGGELDSGNIIERDYLAININTKITECWDWIGKRIPSMFLSAIVNLKKNKNYYLQKQSNNLKDVLRCYPRITKDNKIDWNKSNEDILRLINASNKPYGGAYCYYDNVKLKIWDAEIFVNDENYLSEVGQITKIDKSGSIVVITGKGKLKINLIECNGEIIKPHKKIKSIRKRLE